MGKEPYRTSTQNYNITIPNCQFLFEQLMHHHSCHITILCICLGVLPVSAWASPEPGTQEWHFEVSKGIALELAESSSWSMASVYLRDISPNSQDWNLLLLQAKVELQQNNLNEAKSAIERALQLHPQNPRILTMAGNIAADMGDQDAAEKYYLQVLKLQPHQTAVLMAMARIYYGRQDWKNVISTYEMLNRLVEPTSEVLVRMATACEKLGDTSRAEEYLKRNLEVHPNRVMALLALERFYQRTGDNNKYQETSRERMKYQQKTEGDPRNLRALPSSSK